MTLEYVYKQPKYSDVSTYHRCVWALISLFHWIIVILLLLVSSHLVTGNDIAALEPMFADPVPNISVPLGRDASFPCVVDHLRQFKVAWIKVENKAILSIHKHVITRNYRIFVSSSDNRQFVLHIKNVQESDRGGYMCQVNTSPMISQAGYLEVLVPPRINETESSSDITIREGADVVLICKADGYPLPNITWRREDGQRIPLTAVNGKKFVVASYLGEQLIITRISRLHMGAYLCIASNDVPPSISRRIVVEVEFPPVIWVPTQTLGRRIGEDAILTCHIEAHPTSMNTWMKDVKNISAEHSKYQTDIEKRSYKLLTKLTIRDLRETDFGLYRCLAQNKLGQFEGKINVYELPLSVTQVLNSMLGEELQLSTHVQTNVREGQQAKMEEFNFSTVVPTGLPAIEQTHRKVAVIKPDTANNSSTNRTSYTYFVLFSLLYFTRSVIS